MDEEVPVFIPFSNIQFKLRKCVCRTEDCKYLMKGFQRIKDARGSWFTIPEDGKKKPIHNMKRDSIMKFLQVDSIPKGSVVAMHHFSPQDLMNTCCQLHEDKKSGKHGAIYRWVPKVSSNPDSKMTSLTIQPNYATKLAMEDLKCATRAIADGPVYREKARQTTESMVALWLEYTSRRQSLPPKEKKRLANFSSTVRQFKRWRI